jgi:hypothetical protein
MGGGLAVSGETFKEGMDAEERERESFSHSFQKGGGEDDCRHFGLGWE